MHQTNWNTLFSSILELQKFCVLFFQLCVKEIKVDFLGLEFYWMDCERRSKDIWIDQMQIWERRADSIKLINIQEQQSYIYIFKQYLE